MVEALRDAVEVDLAYHRRLVATGTQQLGQGLLALVELVRGLVVDLAIHVAVLPREHAGTAGPRDGVRHEALGEAHALTRDRVYIRSGDVALVVGADHLIGVVVRHDVDDVEGACGWCGLGCRVLRLSYSSYGGEGTRYAEDLPTVHVVVFSGGCL